MAIPPFPANALDNSDYELGVLLISWFTMVQADDLGLPANQMPIVFVERVRQYVLTIETTCAKNAALEKALHKAASGDFEAAGKFLREHMIDGAISMKFVPIGINKSEQATKFGKSGAKLNKQEGESNRANVLNAAKEILAKRTRKTSKRDLARLIETQTGITLNTVRGHLSKLFKDKILD